MNIEEMNLEEIQARKAEIVARRDAITAELETVESDALDALEQEADALNNEERKLDEREAAINAEWEARQAEIKDVIEHGEEKEKFEERKNPMEVRNSQEYINAYANYIKTGDDAECRALLTENGSGTVATPELVEDIVKHAWEKDGITALVRKTYLKGNVKVGFEISGDAAVVHTEGAAAVSEESLVLGIVNLVPQSIKKWISISDEVYDLRGAEFLNYVYEELTYRIAKKCADLIIADIEACDTVSTTTCPAVAVVESSTVTLGLIAEGLSALSAEAANPTIVMNRQTWAAFKAAQAAGNYGYDPFEGLNVVFNDSIAAFSAATSGVTFAIVGDFGYGAQLNFPNGEGIDLKFDDKTLMTQDLIRILGREYVGHGVVAPKAFVKIAKPEA